MSETRRGPWTVRAERNVYENPWIKVSEYDVLRPDGSPGLYGVMQPKFIAVGVVPVFENGDTLLVGQHRFALDEFSWECPEGGGAKDADLLDTARRELAEETGWRALEYREICSFDVSNSVTNEAAVGYLATGLEPGSPIVILAKRTWKCAACPSMKPMQWPCLERSETDSRSSC